MLNTAEQENQLSTETQPRPILIIDDEASIRRSLEGALRDEGFNTITAADGLTGLKLIETEQPALVLLDIWMPGIDGIETLRQIKDRFPKIGVIMISGHAAIATAMSAIKLGASDFIEKPLDLALTLGAIRRVLDSTNLAKTDQSTDKNQISQFDLGSADRAYELRRVAFEKTFAPGRRVVQRTLSRSAIMYGQGLHSGKKSGLSVAALASVSSVRAT